MVDNAAMIYAALARRIPGLTLEAVAGICGNFVGESGLDPSVWQHGHTAWNLNDSALGYGLAQWTPWTKYMRWVNRQNGLDDSGWTSDDYRQHQSLYMQGDTQCARIVYEYNNGLQYARNGSLERPLTFHEFVVSTESPEYLAKVWAYSYEVPGISPTISGAWNWENQKHRASNARDIYEALGGVAPPSPVGTPLPAWVLKKAIDNRNTLIHWR